MRDVLGGGADSLLSNSLTFDSLEFGTDCFFGMRTVLDEKIRAGIAHIVQEFSSHIFGSNERPYHEGGRLGDVFDAYLNEGLNDTDYFGGARDFVFDNEVDATYPIPTALYCQNGDHGLETLNYIKEGSGSFLKKPGLIFDGSRDAESSRYKPVRLDEQFEFKKWAADEVDGNRFFLRTNALYENGEIIRVKKYDHIGQVAGDLTEFKRDEEIATNIDLGATEHWDFATLDRFLRAISVFCVALGYGTIPIGRQVRDEVAAPEIKEIATNFFKINCLRFNFDRGIIYQRKFGGPLGRPVEWTTVYTDVEIRNRWLNFNSANGLLGILTDDDHLMTDLGRIDQRLNIIESGVSPKERGERKTVKTTVVYYLEHESIEITEVENISELSRIIAKEEDINETSVRSYLQKFKREALRA